MSSRSLTYSSEINSLVSSSSYQQIVAALEASGQTVNATTILAALLASSASTSSVLGQPFGTFGGGLTLTGVTIPTGTLHFSDNTTRWHARWTTFFCGRNTEKRRR